MSNVDKVQGLHAPMGQFINVQRYPPGDFRGVSAPNADTLYSMGWLDLSEPQVFSHPDMGKRFYLFEMTDLWMIDFDGPGARTAGGKAADQVVPQGDVLESAVRSDSRRSGRVAGRGALLIRQRVVDVTGHALPSTIGLVNQRLDAGHAGSGDGCAADDSSVSKLTRVIDLAHAFATEESGVVARGCVQREVRR